MGEICLAGWAQSVRYPGEPLAAWTDCLRRTGVEAARIDWLDVVYCQSWQYDDPARRLAEAVGATPRYLNYSGIGGTRPLMLIAQAAERIASGEAEVCAIVAGEALATIRTMNKTGEVPEWSYPDPDPQPMPFEAPFQPSELAHGITNAYSTFALRDIARRARLGIAPEQYRTDLGELFGAMTNVAAGNPYAWFPEQRTPSELADVAPDNRMVAYPYTKRMTSIMDVDLASAVIVASANVARSMGIAENRLVWIKGWGMGRDPEYLAEHADLSRSPGMVDAFRGAFAAAGSSIDDIDHVDIYSCFPSALSFALDALGLDRSHRLAPFTVTGGLPYAGGAGSGYALGSIAAMADRLIADPGATGLVTAVGMHLSKHAGLVLRSATEPYGGGHVAPDGLPARAIADHHNGPATVAAYTVLHSQDGGFSHGLLVCDIDERTRCYALARDPAFLASLEGEEWVGRQVILAAEGQRNLVTKWQL
jgi:acetyl-CoA C-acetyltransferase